MNKQKLTNTLFYISTLLIVAGILLKISDYSNAVYVFLSGAMTFTISRAIILYNSSDRKKGRILQIQLFSGICLIIAGWFMHKDSNSWSVFVLLSAVIELYASFRGNNFQNKT